MSQRTTECPKLSPKTSNESSKDTTQPDLSQVRRSLAACTAEGVLAEVINACFGTSMLTAWAIHLQAGPLFLGALWALPHFGQLLQLPAAWLTSKCGRRRVAVIGKVLSRAVLAPLAFLPFLSLSHEVERAVVLVAFALAAVCTVLGHNAWLSWMGDLVPASIRGRYFGRRSAFCTIGGTATALTTGAVMDHARASGGAGIALAAVTVAGIAAGLVAPLLMLRQHEPSSTGAAALRARDMTAPFQDRSYRRLLAYQAAWNGATGIAASSYAVHLLQTFRIGFAGLAIFYAAVAGARVLTVPFWGKAIDRIGVRTVIAICTFGSAVSSVLWLASQTSLLPIGLDALLSGAFLAGQELAMFTLPLADAPKDGRPVYIAAFVLTGGFAFGLASMTGGALATALPHLGATLPRLCVFALSAFGRFAAGALALRLLSRHGRIATTLGRGLAATASFARSLVAKAAAVPRLGHEGR